MRNGEPPPRYWRQAGFVASAVLARYPLLIAGLAGRLRCGLRASYSQRQTASVRRGS